MTYEVILRNRASQLVALCDVSGSMNQPIDVDWRKIDTLRELISQLEEMPVWLFSGETWRFDRDEPEALENIEPLENTDLAGALTTLKTEGYKRVLVLTDGIPDSEPDALRAARGFYEIRVRYIGKPPIPSFCEQLARAAGQGGDYEAIEFGRDKVRALARDFLLLAFGAK